MKPEFQIDNQHGPRIVLFDAVGTLIFPRPDVFQAYFQAGVNHGCQISKELIAARFPEAFRNHFPKQWGAAGSRTAAIEVDETIEKNRWRLVVKEVFAEDYSQRLFENLWSHFADPEHWSLAAGAEETVARLLQNELTVGIASNFDSRLVPIISHWLPSIPLEMIFHSTLVGYSKPDVRFFKWIEIQIGKHSNRPKFLMIGDDWCCDVDASCRAGWRSVWAHSSRLPNADKIINQFLRKT